MLNDFPMKLQYFADPNESSSANDNQTGSSAGDQGTMQSESDAESSSNAQSQSDAKYTQSDMDRAMANKDHEVTVKLKESLQADFKAQTQSMVSSAMSYGAKRAKMTDDQRHSDDIRRSESASKSMSAALSSYKARDAHQKAVSTAMDSLTSAGVTNAGKVADFVADSDPAKQDSKTEEFINWYGSTTDSVKKRALSPSANPTNASDPNVTENQSNIPNDPTEMTFDQYAAMRAAKDQQKH